MDNELLESKVLSTLIDPQSLNLIPQNKFQQIRIKIH